MRNFNPFFNSASMAKSAFPFANAGSSFATSATQASFLSRAAGSKITLSGILNGAQKTIGTVNQIVPLYNQIKPMIQNSKALLTVAKGLKGTSFSKKRTSHRNNFQEHPIDINIKEEDINSSRTSNNKNEPSKPFFI